MKDMGIEDFMAMKTNWIQTSGVTEAIDVDNKEWLHQVKIDHYKELAKEGIEFDYIGLMEFYLAWVHAAKPDLNYCIERFQTVDRFEKSEYEYYNFLPYKDVCIDIYTPIVFEIYNYCLSLWLFKKNDSARAFLQDVTKKAWEDECKRLSKYKTISLDTLDHLVVRRLDEERQVEYQGLLLAISYIMGFPMDDNCKVTAAVLAEEYHKELQEFKVPNAKALKMPSTERINEKYETFSNVESDDDLETAYFDLASGLCANKGKTDFGQIHEHLHWDNLITDVATACARQRIRSRYIEEFDGDAVFCIVALFDLYYSEREQAISVIKSLISNNAKAETVEDISQDASPQIIDEKNITNESSDAVNEEIKELRAIIRKKEGLIRQQRELYEAERLNNTVQESLKSENESMRKELAALRKFAYEIADQGDVTVPTKEEEYESMKQQIKGKRIVIIGGYQNWVNKMKQEFPSWKFFSPGATSTIPAADIEAADAVFFHTSCLAHSQYYRYVGVAKRRNIKLGYLSKSSIEDNVVQMYKDIF